MKKALLYLVGLAFATCAFLLAYVTVRDLYLVTTGSDRVIRASDVTIVKESALPKNETEYTLRIGTTFIVARGHLEQDDMLVPKIFTGVESAGIAKYFIIENLAFLSIARIIGIAIVGFISVAAFYEPRKKD